MKTVYVKLAADPGESMKTIVDGAVVLTAPTAALSWMKPAPLEAPMSEPLRNKVAKTVPPAEVATCKLPVTDTLTFDVAAEVTIVTVELVPVYDAPAEIAPVAEEVTTFGLPVQKGIAEGPADVRILPVGPAETLTGFCWGPPETRMVPVLPGRNHPPVLADNPTR